MAEAALHITIQRAGDPEKLGALLNAALATQETAERSVVPEGYRCVECYANDGGHESTCAIAVQAAAAKRREAQSGGAE